MAIKLHQAGYDHAEDLIEQGVEVEHDENNWDEVKPTIDDKLNYLDAHSIDEYGLWFLGIDPSKPADNPDKFVYPTGDFNVVQKSALVLAEKNAKRNNHSDIEQAAQRLLKMMS